MTDALIDALNNPERWRLAVQRLDEDARQLRGPLSDPRGIDYLSRVAGLLERAALLIRETRGVIRREQDTAMLTLTKAILDAGVTGYRLLAGDDTLSDVQRSQYARISSTLFDAACILATVRQDEPLVDQVNAFLVAANCSSTLGGGPPVSPYAERNTLEVLFQLQQAGVQIASDGLAELGIWRSDLLSYPDSARATVHDGLQTLARNLVLST